DVAKCAVFWLPRRSKRHLIRKPNRHHDGFQVVETIGSSVENFQEEIELRRCASGPLGIVPVHLHTVFQLQHSCLAYQCVLLLHKYLSATARSVRDLRRGPASTAPGTVYPTDGLRSRALSRKTLPSALMARNSSASKKFRQCFYSASNLIRRAVWSDAAERGVSQSP